MQKGRLKDKAFSRSKKDVLAKSLDPILDLEEHIRPDWWNRIFNSLYLKTDADVLDDQDITCQEVDIFSEILKLLPEDRILDLCCGQGRHSIELARRGFEYVEGLDRSHYLIQRAKAQAKKEGLNVKSKSRIQMILQAAEKRLKITEEIEIEKNQ